MITALGIWLLIGLLCMLVIMHDEDMSYRELLVCGVVCLILSPLVAVFTIEYLLESWRGEK